MNAFEKLVLSGRIQTQTELRKHFRQLAMKLHPDVSRHEKAGDAFVRLRRDYEEMAARLPAPLPGAGAMPEAQARATIPKPSREDIYQAFWDIEASGFPVAPSVRDSSRFYRARLAEFAQSIQRYGALGNHAFADVEREIYQVRGDDIIDNPLFGKIRIIFYNVVSWHTKPKRLARQAVEKWFAEIDGTLLEKGCPALRAFLKWLVEDMEAGPALDG